MHYRTAGATIVGLASVISSFVMLRNPVAVLAAASTGVVVYPLVPH